MKSNTLAQLLASLGIDQSFSRPHVSDDNPFSESGFKTLKYQPDYPGFFAGLLHARAWLSTFFGWHNDEHQHSGLALFTPAEVFFARVPAVHAVRQAALDAAYASHPERFPNGAPRAALPPASVHINPIEAMIVTVASDAAIANSNAPGEPAACPLQNAPHAAAKTPRREALTPATAALPS